MDETDPRLLPQGRRKPPSSAVSGHIRRGATGPPIVARRTYGSQPDVDTLDPVAALTSRSPLLPATRAPSSALPRACSLVNPVHGQPRSFKVLSALYFCRDTNIRGQAIEINAPRQHAGQEQWTELTRGDLNRPGSL
jgi:hypothetical protein